MNRAARRVERVIARAHMGEGRENANIELRVEYDIVRARAPRRRCPTGPTPRALTPYVMRLDSYAGMWFDQRDNGSLTIALTLNDAATRGAIEARLPAKSRGLHFVELPTPYRQLKVAAKASAKVWDGFIEAGAPKLLSMSVDTRSNGIRVGVAAGDTDAALPYARRLQAQFGVQVSVRQEEVGSDTACTDRDHCTNPLRPGIRLAKGDTTVDDCALAWHVGWEGLTGGGVNFITAGHCGYTGNNCWYHTGYSGPSGRRVGCEIKTLLGPDGFDIMLVGMYDDQACDCMYGSAIAGFWGWIGEASHLGAVVKASRAHTDTSTVGTITDEWASWISDKGGNVRVWGLDTDIPSNPGDSGSPVYFSHDGWGVVGTLSNSIGRVSYFDSCYIAWEEQCWLYDPV